MEVIILVVLIFFCIAVFISAIKEVNNAVDNFKWKKISLSKEEDAELNKAIKKDMPLSNSNKFIQKLAAKRGLNLDKWIYDRTEKTLKIKQ